MTTTTTTTTTMRCAKGEYGADFGIASALSSAEPTCPRTTLTHHLRPIQFSSGYTTSPVDGKRYVFTMNKERYPDFKGLVGKLHQAGIKIVPNVKPCECACTRRIQRSRRSGRR